MKNEHKNYVKDLSKKPIVLVLTSFGLPILALLWDYILDKVDKSTIFYFGDIDNVIEFNRTQNYGAFNRK